VDDARRVQCEVEASLSKDDPMTIKVAAGASLYEAEEYYRLDNGRFQSRPRCPPPMRAFRCDLGVARLDARSNQDARVAFV
jgi:hypothetical protein